MRRVAAWVVGLALLVALLPPTAQGALVDTGTPLRAQHLSGRYDRSPSLLLADVRAATKTADILTLTEVSRRSRDAALRRSGFTVLHARHADTAVLVNPKVWRVLKWKTVWIGPDPGPGGVQRAVFALLRHKSTGATLLVSVTHLPPSLERRWGSAQAAAYRHTVARWRSHVRKWVGLFGPDATMLNADWNLNLHKPWVRRWQRSAFSVSRPPSARPSGGSLGYRLIDWPVLSQVSNVVFRILPKTPASDHRRVTITGTIK